jgi:hypothetical protein
MISYSRTDSDFVDRLQRDLMCRGFPVWVDRTNIAGGARWADDIDAAIDGAEVVLVVCSPAAMGSRWVRRECRRALNGSKFVIPLRYYPCSLPRELERLQALDFPVGINLEAMYVRQLDDALRGTLLLELDLTQRPEALDGPRLARWETRGPKERGLPPGTGIAEVYYAADGHLLILGAPGAGKTTQLLHIGQQLAERARHDQAVPLPVLLSLASWASSGLPLSAWMIRELVDSYDDPRRLARARVEGDEVLPLLDGLDEVVPSRRGACADAINVYGHRHGLVPLVVCCRSEEYQALGTRLGLQAAVEVEPLSDEQVEAALVHAGEVLAGVCAALGADRELRQLVKTPLMLCVVTLAYSGQPRGAIPQGEDREAFRRPLFGDYVTRIMQRRGGVTFKRMYVERWLRWLATQMKSHDRSEFYLERMQPDWLADRGSAKRYRRTVGLSIGIAVGLITGLVTELASTLGGALDYGLAVGPAGTLATGLIAGLVFGLMTWLSSTKLGEIARWWRLGVGLGIGLSAGLVFGQFFVGSFERLDIYGLVYGLSGWMIARLGRLITSVEAVHWSWRGLGIGLGAGLCATLGVGLVSGVASGLDSGLLSGLVSGPFFYWLGYGTGVGASQGALGGPVIGLSFGLVVGLVSRQINEHDLRVPNEGIRCSFATGLIIKGIAGPGGGIVGGLISEFGHPVPIPLAVARLFGLSFCAIIGLAGGLAARLGACIQHWALRWQLERAGSMPRRYVSFLEFCVDHILLQRVGGGFRFTHALLLDYFATLYAEGTTGAS